MNCVRCKKECLSNELVNGYCYECRKYLGIDEENKENLKYENIENEVGHKILTISSIMQIGIILSIVSGLAYALLFKDELSNVFIGIISGLISAISFYFFSLLLEALAEILNLLENIKYKF